MKSMSHNSGRRSGATPTQARSCSIQPDSSFAFRPWKRGSSAPWYSRGPAAGGSALPRAGNSALIAWWPKPATRSPTRYARTMPSVSRGCHAWSIMCAPASGSKYGAIVRTLGLYRGPPIEDFSALMKTVLTSQVGAYYDPQKRSFFVLMANMPDMALGVMYSHELYHALQDQYFDLVKYIDGDRKDGKPRNADQHLARSAVVEGEASYMMSLWMMQKMTGKPPARDMMATVVSMQANMSMDNLREMMKQPEVAKMMGDDMKGAVDSAANIPEFIMDSMIGVYLRGLSFVFAVHEQGWPAVGHM